MICTQCGASNRDTSKFCMQCGARLSPPAEAAEPVAPTPAVPSTPIVATAQSPDAPSSLVGPGITPAPTPDVPRVAQVEPPASPTPDENVPDDGTPLEPAVIAAPAPDASVGANGPLAPTPPPAPRDVAAPSDVSASPRPDPRQAETVAASPAAPASPESGVICPNCQTPNRAGARFCQKCSEPLSATRRCPTCGAENRVQARYCRSCRNALMVKAPPRLGTGNLSPTTVIGHRYEIRGKIAQGGMGAVYVVSDTHLRDPRLRREKLWALKEMSETAFPPDQLAQAIEMFRTEASMLAQLEHANLPEVVDFFEYGTRYYLVMTFISGETLEARLKKNSGPFDVDTVLKYTRQLVGVLEYLHNQNPPIIYRDLKPSNIMIEYHSGLLKLIDFGIARFQRKRTSRQLGMPGADEDDAGIGTMGYAPPEQWKKGEVSPAADVYALGVTLHQFLTNHDPTTTPFCLPPNAELNPQVPAWLCDLLARAYEPSLVERFPTLLAFERALGAAEPRR